MRPTLFLQPLPLSLRSSSPAACAISQRPIQRPRFEGKPNQPHSATRIVRRLVQLSKAHNQIQPEHEHEDGEDNKQRDKSYAFREFGKVLAGAMLIGLLLFFYDLVISLMAFSIAIVYAIAVLFEVRPEDTLVMRTVSGAKVIATAATRRMRQSWQALRRKVRKLLED